MTKNKLVFALISFIILSFSTAIAQEKRAIQRTNLELFGSQRLPILTGLNQEMILSKNKKQIISKY